MLPSGYAVCLLLVTNPIMWKKVCNEIAVATNNGTKVPEEVHKTNEKCILGTMCVTSIVLSYVNFYLIGFD